MYIFQFRFIFQLTTALSLLFGATSNAQELPIFLRDVIRGNALARDQLEHRIYHLQVARELAYRTLLLSRCVNFRESVNDPRFDEFSETLLKDLSSSDPEVLTIFTVVPRLQDAGIQNHLTDAQIEVIDKIMRSPRYQEFVDYLSFERAELEIAAGFTDVNTGEKAPWVASSALSFLRQSQFFPLLLKNISAPDRALLNNRLLDGVKPSQTITDQTYLEALTVLFEKQVDTRFLRTKLPAETNSLLTLYQLLGVDAMQGNALLSVDIPPEARSPCKSKNGANCVDDAWLNAAIALKKQFEDTQIKTASVILKSRFADFCKLKLD